MKQRRVTPLVHNNSRGMGMSQVGPQRSLPTCPPKALKIGETAPATGRGAPSYVLGLVGMAGETGISTSRPSDALAPPHLLPLYQDNPHPTCPVSGRPVPHKPPAAPQPPIAPSQAITPARIPPCSSASQVTTR